MAVIFTQAGLEYDLNVLVSNYSGLKMGLFQNNVTPSLTTSLSDLVECNFEGYTASHPPDGRAAVAGWSGVTFNTPSAQSTATSISWTATGGAVVNNVYGYFVINAAGVLVFFEKNPAGPVPINAAGQSYFVGLTKTLQNQGA